MGKVYQCLIDLSEIPLMSRPLPPGDPVTHPGDKDSDHHGTDPDREDMAAGGVLGHGVASKPYPDLIHWVIPPDLTPTLPPRILGLS